MIHSSAELDAAFSALDKEPPDALIVQPSLPIRRVAERRSATDCRRCPSFAISQTRAAC
jgi:hypothetical protein